LRALRRSFRHLGRISPSFSARLAEHLFRTPPRTPLLKREERSLALARRSTTPFPDAPLPTWTWGKGPAVLLVHGWGGHAGRLTAFVEPLTRAGFSVVAFDAPGHGSARGRHSSLPEFVDAIQAVARAHGPFEAVVGHSLGAAACALALRAGLEVGSLVLLAPPADPEKYSGRFARFFGIPANTRDAMKRRLEGRYQIQWEQLRVSGGPGASRARLLVFHDPRDWKVPFKDGLEIVASWPRAELVRTHGAGHHRILRNRRVIARAVAFLAGKSSLRPASRSARRTVPPLRPALVS
jgi:pimeloyl-ACP methyl ester carboxylesterase